MNPVMKALWFIESNFAREITLDDVAEVAGVSKYYMTRAFGRATGTSVMQYVRARRLAEAARRLAAGAPHILSIALEAGYGSHEAFTRAFREEFGLTPESVRAQGHVNTIELKEPLMMDETTLNNLTPPQFVDGKPMLIAGIGERYNAESSAGIPAQWQRFVPHLGSIRGQIGKMAYGVICNTGEAGEMDYISGVEVADVAKLPKEWRHIQIPKQRYAVFSHGGHISSIRQVWDTIWNKWLPESGKKIAEGPEFERYSERFDSVTGNGGFEIWIPLKD